MSRLCFLCMRQRDDNGKLTIIKCARCSGGQSAVYRSIATSLQITESLSPVAADLCTEEIETLQRDLRKTCSVGNDPRWKREQEREREREKQSKDNWLRALQKQEREEQLLKSQKQQELLLQQEQKQNEQKRQNMISCLQKADAKKHTAELAIRISVRTVRDTIQTRRLMQALAKPVPTDCVPVHIPPSGGSYKRLPLPPLARNGTMAVMQGF